jgi:hypothetical protein
MLLRPLLLSPRLELKTMDRPDPVEKNEGAD